MGSPLETQLRQEMAKPLAIAPSLLDFVKKVFANQTIMAGPDHVDDLIYKLYTGDGAIDVPTPDFQQQKQFITAVWNQVKNDGILKRGYLQYANPPVTLEQLYEFITRDPPPSYKAINKLCKDFIYFNVGRAGPAYRVYANADFSHAPSVLGCLKLYMGLNPATHGIDSLKLVGPAALAKRADVFVIYCTSKEKAQTLAQHLVELQGLFKDPTTGMTTRVGVGISLGAEPEWQATGMGSPRPQSMVDKNYAKYFKYFVEQQHYPEKKAMLEALAWAHRDAFQAQSFGSLRAELIASAILHYNLNTDVFGKGLEVFARFVCAAFRGAGLDPTRPGD